MEEFILGKIHFDSINGRLKTDMPQYLKKHDLVFTSVDIDADNALVCGTGKMGVCTWFDNGMKMQFTNVDGSPQTQYSSAQIQIAPLFDIEKFSGRFSIGEGTLTFCFGEDLTYEIIGGCADEFMAIKVTDKKMRQSELQLCMWDVKSNHNEYMMYNVNNEEAWKTYKINIDNNPFKILSLIRGENEALNYGYTFSIFVTGADYEIENNGEYKLKINPCKPEYTIWIINPARKNTDLLKFKSSYDKSLYIANKLSKLDINDYEDLCKKFWADFWNKSIVVYSSLNDDYIENYYYLSKYTLACAMMGTTPCHFINGVFRSHGDVTKWSAAYWQYNQRMLYNGLLATGGFELIKPYFAHYINNLDTCREITRKLYHGDDGILIPETFGHDGNHLSNTDSPYVNNIHTAGVEAALTMYQYYLFTGDVEVLEQFVILGCEVARHYLSSVLSKDENGKFFIPFSNSREIFWNVKNPVTDIAAIKALFPILIVEGNQYGVQQEFINNLSDVVENLTSFEIAGTPKRMMPCDTKSFYALPKNNLDDPCLEMLYPFNQSGIDKPFYHNLIHNYEYRYGRYQLQRCISWDNSNIWAARLGLGNECYYNTASTIGMFQVFRSGLGWDGNCGFESMGNTINAVNEALLQSYDGVIRVFPAVLNNIFEFNAKFSLYATGGFIVSSEYTYDNARFDVLYIGIQSLYGNKIKIYNPWNYGLDVSVVDCKNNLEIYRLNTEILEFSTEKNKIYFIRPTCSNCDYRETDQLISNPNMSAKTFRYNEFTVHLGN
jgi:alpha-L-fucosidase 2